MTTLGPYAALDHVFAVEVVNGDDPVLADLFAPLATDRAATHTYRMARPGAEVLGWIEIEGERREKEDLGSLHHRLLMAVGVGAQEALEDAVVHGCLVEHRGTGVLLAGRSGSGKSTFTARLLADGAGLVTEDVTAFDAGGRVRPYPRPLALSAETFELLALPVPEDDCGCGCMEHVVHPQTLGGRIGTPRPVALVALCDCDSSETEQLSLSHLLAELFEQACMGVSSSTELELVASALSGATCVRLGTMDLDAAVASLDALVGSTPPVVQVASERLEGGSALYLDGELLIHHGEVVHHLDAAATAVWVLHTDGLSAEGIAAELGWDQGLVAATLDRLRELELPGPAR